MPTGFHFVSLSSVSANDLVKMLPGALAIVIVGLAQALAIAKSYAAKYHYAVDANREMLGYGAANLGAGALQGYTVTGGLSASGAAERSGAKSPAAFLVSALMALLTILFLAGLFADLPEPVLGAVVIWAVSGMIKPGRVTQYRRAQSLEFWAALGALLGVILIDILPGVAIGVALSFILLIHTIGHPHIAVLGRSSDGARFSDLEDDPGATPIPGVLIHRFEAELIFANADLFQDDLLARVRAAEPTPGAVVLDFEAVSQVDVTGEEALRSVHDTLDALGIRLIVARAKSRVRDALRRGGTVDVLGEDNLVPIIDSALDAIEASRVASGHRGRAVAGHLAGRWREPLGVELLDQEPEHRALQVTRTVVGEAGMREVALLDRVQRQVVELVLLGFGLGDGVTVSRPCRRSSRSPGTVQNCALS